MPTLPTEPTRPAIILRANGKIEERPDFPYRNLKAMQEIVGGYVEAIAIHPNKVNALCTGTSIRFTGRVDLVVNEDGRRKELPLNARVSRIFGQVILGDVLLVQLHRAGEEN